MEEKKKKVGRRDPKIKPLEDRRVGKSTAAEKKTRRTKLQKSYAIELKILLT
jgi:hypothetical protein